MQFLHTAKCCCCADLRTGGMIIGFLGLLQALGYLSGGATGSIGTLISLLVNGALLYGIFAKKADFVLPAAIFHIIVLALLAIADVVFFICIFAARQVIIDTIKKAGKEIEPDGPYWGIAIPFIIALILVTALVWHFTSVLYSLWKNMKEGARPNAMYGA